MSPDGEAQSAAGVREGEILAGKYRIERVLGVGGMGVVLAARHLQLDTLVAMKFLLPAMLQDEEAVARFAREARNAVRITSEHVARVLDVGLLANGAPFMVMEYLQGADLSVLLRQRGPLAVEEAADYVLQALEAIAEAHALGIVHRDLKPANLFRVRGSDGRPFIKVLDFGISKATAAGRPPTLAVTAAAAVMGSPLYMSPEQMESASTVDMRTDIWALGIIVHELLTGKVPFSGDTFTELAFKVATRPPPPLRAFRPDVPEALQAIVLRCLEKDRDRRYPNVAALAAALLPFAADRFKASVERIADILRAAGLSTPFQPTPSHPVLRDPERTVPGPEVGPDPSPPVPPHLAPPQPAAASQSPHVETIAPLGRTTSGTGNARTVTGLLAMIAAVALAGGVIALRRWSPLPDLVTAAPPSAVPAIIDSHDATPDTPKAACTAGAMQCDGPTPRSCRGGQWISGPVTAGQCGALCTPGAAGPRCSGAAPETCAEGGQWVAGAACSRSRMCRDGACVPAPSPGPPAVTPPQPSIRPSAGGAPDPAPSSAAPAASCRVVKEYDSEGDIHFKQVCN